MARWIIRPVTAVKIARMIQNDEGRIRLLSDAAQYSLAVRCVMGRHRRSGNRGKDVIVTDGSGHFVAVNRRFKTGHQIGALTSQSLTSILLRHKFLHLIAEGLVAKKNAAHHPCRWTVESADQWLVLRAD